MENIITPLLVPIFLLSAFGTAGWLLSFIFFSTAVTLLRRLLVTLVCAVTLSVLTFISLPVLNIRFSAQFVLPVLIGLSVLFVVFIIQNISRQKDRNMMPILHIVFRELYHALLFFSILFLALEMIQRGIVSNIFNINIMLLLIIPTGIVAFVTEVPDAHSDKAPSTRSLQNGDLIMVTLLSVLGGWIMNIRLAPYVPFSLWAGVGFAGLVWSIYALFLTH